MTGSAYIFLNSGGFGDGVFEQFNVTVPDNPALPVGYILRTGNVWEANRPSSEIAIDLLPRLAQPFTNLINGIIAQAANLGLSPYVTKQPFVKIVPWVLVPYFPQRPLSHSALDILVRAYATIHLPLPCVPDADVTVSIYIFPTLINKHLTVFIDGAWVEVDGGWPIGNILTNFIGNQVKAALQPAQGIVNTALAPYLKTNFRQIYLLPGDGNKQNPTWFGDADIDATLAIVP